MAADYRKISRYSPETADVARIDVPHEGKRAGGKIQIIRGHEIDPNQALENVKGQVGKRRQRVAINRNTDALEREHSYGRLSPAAYRAGTIYQRIIERSRGATSGGCSMEPSNGGGSNEQAMAARMDAAEATVHLRADARKAIGPIPECILSCVLGDRLPFPQVAAKLAQEPRAGAGWYRSKGGSARAVRLFRKGLEDLAEYWDLHGEPQ